MQQVDRHDHVEMLVSRLPSRARSSCSEPMPISSPFGRDQRGAAPIGMRRIGEDRLVEHVFPIAGEFLLGGDAAGERAGAPAGAADHHALADLGGARGADRQRRQVDRAERLHQAEAGLLVEAERVAFHHAAVAEMQPDGLGFGDQIADGQHQAVVDQHAVAGALDAERLGGEGVGRDDRMQADHRGQRALEIVSHSPPRAAAPRAAPSIRSARPCRAPVPTALFNHTRIKAREKPFCTAVVPAKARTHSPRPNGETAKYGSRPPSFCSVGRDDSVAPPLSVPTRWRTGTP